MTRFEAAAARAGLRAPGCSLLALLFALLLAPASFVAHAQSASSLVVRPGANLVGLPVEPAGTPDLGSMLRRIGDAGAVSTVTRLNPSSGALESCGYDEAGHATGADCSAPVSPGEGVWVVGRAGAVVPFEPSDECPTLSLPEGVHWVSLPCVTGGVTAHSVLRALGQGTSTASVQRLDAHTGRWHSAVWSNGFARGPDFPLIPGEGYRVQVRDAVTFRLPGAPDVSRIARTAPMRGVTVVSGEAGAVDAGTTVAVSNPESGFTASAVAA